jgi:hypothetical protein
MKLEKSWNPKHWASWKPFGFGEQRPNNYLELTRAVWENRDELPRAWRILNEGVCDGCALGTKGLSDWTLPGPHLCNIRLRLLRLNTMPPFDLNLLSNPLECRIARTWTPASPDDSAQGRDGILEHFLG